MNSRITDPLPFTDQAARMYDVSLQLDSVMAIQLSQQDWVAYRHYSVIHYSPLHHLNAPSQPTTRRDYPRQSRQYTQSLNAWV
jgi:hypothetical protein